MNRKILLIDDEFTFRETIKHLFEDKPYELIEADSPQQGILKLETDSQIRVILLDLNFPGGGELTVLNYIKGRQERYRVIVLTAHAQLPAEMAGKYKVFHYLSKPPNHSNETILFSVKQAFNDLEMAQLHRKLGFLLEVQKEVSTGAKDTKKTLDRICELVRVTVDAYTCHIRVYDFENGDYHLRGFAGNKQMRRIFERPRLKKDLFSGEVIAENKPALYADLQNLAKFRRFKADALNNGEVSDSAKQYWDEIRSAYIMPISTGLLGEQADAVLNVSSNATDHFTPEKCATVEEFGSLANLLITKDWLQKKPYAIHKDYGEISKDLNEMSDALKHSDLLRVYEKATRSISRLVSAELVSVFLWNWKTARLENIAELRGDKFFAASAVLHESYAADEGWSGKVYSNKRPFVYPRPQNVPPEMWSQYYFDGKLPEEMYLRKAPYGKLEHYLGVPIKVGDNVRGVLRAMNKKSGYYDDMIDDQKSQCLLERGFSLDCQNEMEIFATHLGVAIRNSELLRATHEQVEQIRSLNEIGNIINEALEIDKVVELTIKQMADVMKAEICMLFLKRGDRIVLKKCFKMPMIEGAFYMLGEGATGRVVQTGQAELITPSRDEKGKYDDFIRKFLQDVHGKDIESIMIAPLISKNTVLGALKVINKRRDHSYYNESDLKLFENFASYVSVAVANAQNYSRLSVFLRATAHEMTDHLLSIPLNTGTIRASLGTPSPSIERSLKLIEEDTRHIKDFINANAGFSTTEKNVLDINEEIRSEVEILQGKIGTAVALEFISFPRQLECEIYRMAFLQCLKNIVTNAVEQLEGRADGVIQISTSDTRERDLFKKLTGSEKLVHKAVIHIRDNGPGIAADIRDKIFEIDFTTKQSRGHGIGLWMVQTQLELIGGTIEVETPPGPGALFVIKIPIWQREQAAT